MRSRLLQQLLNLFLVIDLWEVYLKMKIGNTTIDAADVGNGCLLLGVAVSAYGLSAGNPVFAIEALAVGAALKAVASGIDNYLFKKAAKVA